MIALTSNPADWALAVVIAAAVLVGAIGYVRGRCQCLACQERRAR